MWINEGRPMEDVERQLAELMAEILRTRIKELEAPNVTGRANSGSARLALVRNLLAELERQQSSYSHAAFRAWNDWVERYPL
jgi:hypothetical protein